MYYVETGRIGWGPRPGKKCCTVLSYLEKEKEMRGWRTKFIFLLIVYFAGFASAIYALAPTPQDQDDEGGVLNSDFQVSSFAKSFNSGMHKAIGAGKEAAQHAAKFLKQKIDEHQSKSNS